jgi:hypothetical protein
MKSLDVANNAVAGDVTTLRPYVQPCIRVMDEKDVLSALQVTVASITWWVM